MGGTAGCPSDAVREREGIIRKSINKLRRASRAAVGLPSSGNTEGGALHARRPGGDLRAIAVLGAFQVGVAVANLARVKVVALESGPAGLGLVTLIEQIVLLAALAFTLSLPFAAVKFLSFAHSQSRRSFVRAYIGFRRALTGLSLVGLGVALLIAFVMPAAFGAEVAANREVLIVACSGIPLLNLLTLLVRALAASGRSRAAGAVTLAQAAGLAVGAGAGVIVGGLNGYFVGAAAGLLGALLAGTAYLRRAERTGEHGTRVQTFPELGLHPGILRFALVHSVIMLSTPAAFLFARYAVLGEAGLEEVGLLAAAFSVSAALTMLFTPGIALFLTPALNRGDPPLVKLKRTLGFRRSMLFAIGAAMLPLMLFPRTAVVILFSAAFTPVAAFIYLFVIGEALGLLSGIHQALLVGLDDFGINVTYVVAGQVLLTVLVVLLVPAIGIAGVGIALVADHALVLALTTWRLWRRHRMAMLEGLAPVVPMAIAIAAVGATVPSLPGGGLVFLAKITVLAVFLVLGVVLYRAKSAGAQHA